MMASKGSAPTWQQVAGAIGVAGVVVYMFAGDTWERIRKAPQEINELRNEMTKYASGQEYLRRDVEEARRAAERAAQTADEIKGLIQQQQPYPPQWPAYGYPNAQPSAPPPSQPPRQR